MENINLFNDDCLKKLKDICDNYVDCFILDLPYGTTSRKWDIRIDLNELWLNLKRISKNKHTPYFFFCDMKLAVDIINSNRKWFRYDIVIQKSNIVGFLNAKKMPMREHELLLVFYEKLPRYNIDGNHQIKSLHRRKQPYDDNIYGKVIRQNHKYYNPPLPRSIIKMNNNNRKRFHKTEKSQDILEWIIKYYTIENNVILDPTMGSGSTGIACKKLNRRFIGIELNKDFYEIAKKRIDEFML